MSIQIACWLLEDREGAIWVATYTAGVARLRQGKVEAFGAGSGLPSLDVRMLYQDKGGTIWAGTIAGLARFDGRRFVPVTEPGAPAEGASTMLEDRAGTLWFGSSEGLFRLRNGVFDRLTRKDGLLSNWVMSLHEDQSGALWIGTNGEGINRLRDGRISSIRPSDGLWDGVIQVILEDRLGNLDDRVKSIGIHRLGAGLKGDIDPFRPAERTVFRDRAWILGEIFCRGELSGFTKILTTSASHCNRVARISARWPSCSAPIVGTNPIVTPSRWSCRLQAAMALRVANDDHKS